MKDSSLMGTLRAQPFGGGEDLIGTRKVKKHINPDGTLGGWVCWRSHIQENVFIHSTATVLCSRVESGTKIGAMVYIDKGTEIGRDVEILSKVSISSLCTIGNGCFIGSGTVLGNNVQLKENVTIGSHAFLQFYVTVGKNVVLADSIILERDVRIPDNTSWSRAPFQLSLPYTTVYMVTPGFINSGCLSVKVSQCTPKKLSELCDRHGYPPKVTEKYLAAAKMVVGAYRSGFITCGGKATSKRHQVIRQSNAWYENG